MSRQFFPNKTFVGRRYSTCGLVIHLLIYSGHSQGAVEDGVRERKPFNSFFKNQALLRGWRQKKSPSWQVQGTGPQPWFYQILSMGPLPYWSEGGALLLMHWPPYGAFPLHGWDPGPSQRKHCSGALGNKRVTVPCVVLPTRYSGCTRRRLRTLQPRAAPGPTTEAVLPQDPGLFSGLRNED